MQKAVEHLLRNPAIQRLGSSVLMPQSRPSTGFPELDAVLPGGGWPSGCLIEILSEHEGIGELSLLMPALAALSKESRWIAWVSPPHIPYGPALVDHDVDLARVLLVHARPGKDALWAAEQGLISSTCSTVLAWPGEMLDDRALRRLQLAAEKGDSSGFVFRSSKHVTAPSPAALRLMLEPTAEGLLVQVLKCRGAAGATVLVEMDDALVEPVFPRIPPKHPRPRCLHH